MKKTITIKFSTLIFILSIALVLYWLRQEYEESTVRLLTIPLGLAFFFSRMSDRIIFEIEIFK